MRRTPAHSHRNVLRPLEGVLVNALDHGLDLFQWADLIEILDLVHDHLLDGLLPKHLAGELFLHVVNKLLRVGARHDLLACQVEVDATPRRLHPGERLVQSLREPVGGRLHERAMESPTRLDGPRLQRPRGERLLAEHVDGALGARADEAAGEEDVRNLAYGGLHGAVGGPRLGAEALQGLPVQPRHRGHALRGQFGGLLHGLRSQLHEPQTVLKLQHTSCADCGVLAQAEASHGLWSVHHFSL
mmetsp:Transcript_27377/g.90999  ORF Transcript_27377/g.90999 Transcript_27377/m.90999 type:complete len:244 (+) Transcript_27377:39-770(+)